MDDARSKAIAKVLYTLRNPLLLMSVIDREETLKLARDHAITAEELLDCARSRARNA